MRAVAASMRRQGLTGLNTHPRPARRGGRPLWPMRITVRAGGIKAPWIGCGSRTLPICGARKAGSTCAPCVMRTRVECSDTPWVSSKALTWSSPRSTWPLPPVAPSPQVVLHADRGTQFTSEKLAAYMRAVKGTVSMGRAGVCWDNAMAESFGYPQNRVLLPARLHHPRPGLHRGRHLDRRLLQPPPHPHQPRRQIPHRIRTTPSGLDNSRINKPSTTCAQAQGFTGF